MFRAPGRSGTGTSGARGPVALLGAFLLAVPLAGCQGSPDDTGPLPAAPAALATAADTMTNLRSARFDLGVNGQLPGVNVHSAKGRFVRGTGGTVRAQGQATVQRDGRQQELEFVLADPWLYLKTADAGGFTRAPASQVTGVYDPAVLLDSRRGIANVLRQVRQPRTEGSETIDEQRTYRIGGMVPAEALAPVLPGLAPGVSTVEAKFWLGEDPSRPLVRAWIQLPPTTQGAGARMIELQLSELGKPVTVRPPGS